MNQWTTLWIGILCLMGFTVVAQGDFYMSNQTINNCYGNFFDSDLGMPAGNYDHNENLTFTICVPQATQITMVFSQFCTEAVLDYIRFYDGPDTLSPLLFGPWSGANAPPPIVATSGCLTINFISDVSVACDGWSAQFFSDVPPPVPPNITSAIGTCNSNQVTLGFDGPIDCDSLNVGAFDLIGTPGYNIVNVTPNPCTNDSATSVILTLDNIITECASFNLDFNLNLADACDSIHNFTLSQAFDVFDCPLDVQLQATSDSLCGGGCADIIALVNGGDCNYTYTWNNGWPATGGPHQICTSVDSTIIVTVSDGQGLISSDTLFIYAIQAPDAGPDTSVCDSYGIFQLNGASPGGGIYSGPGIIAPTGQFDPAITGPGTLTILYDFQGCIDSLEIIVYELDAGPDTASCPGSGPILLNQMNVPGGTWSGPNITPGGVFATPAAVDSFVVFYTANGCTDSLTVYVDSIAITPIDSVCESEPIVQLSFTPPGGNWSGPGIVDGQLGYFDPDIAGGGLHILTYSINGCAVTEDIYVKPIDIGTGSILACPQGDTLTLPTPNPTGGYWSGNGVIDSISGSYFPDQNAGNNYNNDVYYHLNGCVDTLRILGRVTRVDSSIIRRCITDGNVDLNNNSVGRSPWNGNWSGPGVIDPNYPGTFDPIAAGPGVHTLIYDANGCQDSVIIEVFEVPIVNDTTVCEGDGLINLTESVQGGIWTGPGIVVDSTGVFDPSIAGAGTHTLYYDLFQACNDSMVITVDALPVIDMSFIDSAYCFIDTVIDLNITPVGGTLTGGGVIGNNWNPSLAGSGVHLLRYEVVNGTCLVQDSVLVFVRDTLQASSNIDSTSICYGDSVTVDVSSSGGESINIQYLWSDSLGTGPTQTLNPLASQTYFVTVTDNCSDPVIIPVFVEVYPEIQITLLRSDTVCYDSTGWVSIQSANATNYQFTWLTNPVQTGGLLETGRGTYYVESTDPNTGCSVIDTIELPSFSQLNANFSINPNFDCLYVSEATVNLIDFSIGGELGYWNWGDGTGDQAYSLGDYLQHTYSDSGIYTVTLYLENEGGCLDIHQESLCIELDPGLWVPNAFTPDEDNLNEGWRPEGSQIEEYRMVIYDRWGEKMFETIDFYDAWNGTYNGEPAKSDAYEYRIWYRYIDAQNTRELRGQFYLIR